MIPAQEARGLFNKMLVDVYAETTSPTNFLRSFFKDVESDTKNVAIEVTRGTEKVAVDVLRGTEGNRNTFSRFSEKMYEPPFFKEWFDATELDFYDRLFGEAANTPVNAIVFSSWLGKVAEKLRLLQDKIERAYEVQISEVLQTGIVQVSAGNDNIDFKRKAASIVDLGAGSYWPDAGVNPVTSLIEGGKFLRTKGKAQGGVYNLICGEAALEALINNTAIKERADIKNFDLEMIHAPQANSVGGVLHGRISAGSYKINLWTYPEFYENSAGTLVPYIEDKNVIMLPMAPNFTMAFAAVPKIVRDTRNAEFPEFISNGMGKFHFGNYIDGRTDKHVFDIKSAGLPIPTAVDQIWTAQVVA